MKDTLKEVDYKATTIKDNCILIENFQNEINRINDKKYISTKWVKQKLHEIIKKERIDEYTASEKLKRQKRMEIKELIQVIKSATNNNAIKRLYEEDN